MNYSAKYDSMRRNVDDLLDEMRSMIYEQHKEILRLEKEVERWRAEAVPFGKEYKDENRT